MSECVCLFVSQYITYHTTTIHSQSHLGFSLLSAFEYEFRVFDLSSPASQSQFATHQKLTPLWDFNGFGDHVALSLFDDFVFECEEHLRAMDIPLSAMHLEAAPGQFEWPLAPQWDIRAADAAFTYRTAIKQLAQQRQWMASFCTAPVAGEIASGAHFNHSLWKGGVNVLVDADSPDGLSDVCRFWVGGILHHMPSLTAFANQTDNCFRRTQAHSWAPGNSSWGFDNRMCMVRVKTGGEDQMGTYLEYRLPPSACNPYLVIASLIVAGMDGVSRKIAPPKPCDGDPFAAEYALTHKPIPPTLADALEALEDDRVMCEAFGELFVQVYRGVRREDINELKKVTEQFEGNKAKAETFLYSKL